MSPPAFQSLPDVGVWSLMAAAPASPSPMAFSLPPALLPAVAALNREDVP